MKSFGGVLQLKETEIEAKQIIFAHLNCGY